MKIIDESNNVILRNVAMSPEHRQIYKTFSYDKESNEFVINGQHYPEGDGLDIRQTKDGRALTDKEIISSPILLDGFGRPIAGVAIDAWVKQERSQAEEAEITLEVLDVMYGVFSKEYHRQTGVEFHSRIIRKDIDGKVSDHLGFRFFTRPDVFAGLDFQVLGNCACLGNDFTSWFTGKTHEGVFMYTFHNIDQEYQRLALYAGVGHVAQLSKETFEK